MNTKKKCLGLVAAILSLSFSVMKAQDYSVTNVSIIQDGRNLVNPGTGGIRSGQFSQIDFDNDGLKDLFVFDRTGGVVLPFLNKGSINETNYVYAPEYKKIFPKIKAWAYLKDFNGDGLEDLFMCPSQPGIAGVEVRRAKRINGEISFDLVTFDYGSFDALMFPSGSSFPPIYVSIIDYPAIVDVDGDGDLDILTFEPGGSNVHWYLNRVVEENLGLDTFKFVIHDQCWGKFLEQEQSEEVLLSNSPSTCAHNFHGGNEGGSRHSGSTLLAFDGDGDGDLELILGDLSNDNLVYLINGGNPNAAFMVDQDVTFPSYDTPVVMDIFLGMFYLDMDNDGKRDLITTPNDEGGAQNFDHIWFYKNIGEDNAPVFELQTRNILLNQTFSLGGGSDPEFLDYNQDGLMDLIVGNNGFRETGGNRVVSLTLLENTGGINEEGNPVYEVVDEDYLGFSAFAEIGGRFSPSVGDLDGDGDMDMLVGDSQGKLYYCNNNAGVGNPFSFDLPEYEYADIAIGQNALPQIIDLDNDGLADIIVGEKNTNQNSEGLQGGVNFYKNIGSIGNPQFNSDVTMFPNNNVLGGINTRDFGFVASSSSPYFYNHGTTYSAVVGSDSGVLRLYRDIEGNLYDTFTVVSDYLGEIFLGRRSNPALYDIDGDGFLEMCVGNERGGLEFFNTGIKLDGTLKAIEEKNIDFKLFPNPTSGQITIEASFAIDEVHIMDVHGRLVYKYINFEQSPIHLSLIDVDPGVYMCTILASGQKVTKRIVRL